MRVAFHGVRGSMPTPGRLTAGYGGNTSCVHVRMPCGTDLVFDAGTGLVNAGHTLLGRGTPIHLLMTHSHWDHIQGFPFFPPIFEAGREILVTQPMPDGNPEHLGVLEQMNGHNFPLTLDQLPCAARYASDEERAFPGHAFRVTTKALNHPGGGTAFRVDGDGVSIAYVTDNELTPPGDPATPYDDWVRFCAGVDVLVHDAQYRETDMPHKHGWGHSLISQVRELARDAEVGCLALYHHDPMRSDGELEEVRLETETLFNRWGGRTRALVAHEGMVLEFTPRRDVPASLAISGNALVLPA